jgi:hypothetical protein
MSQTTLLHATLDISRELFNEWGCTDLVSVCLELQCGLLIVEPFSQCKLYQIKTEFGGVLGVVGKPLASWIIISQFSELRCERY